MMILLNPRKRKYNKPKTKTKSKSKPRKAKAKSRPKKKKKVCYTTSSKDAVRRWACSPKRAKYLSADDAYRLCARRDAKRWKPKRSAAKYTKTEAASSAAEYMARPMFNPMRRNPSGVLGNVTEGFRPNLLLNALPLAAGVLLNYKLTPMLTSRFAFMQSGVGNIAAGLATAGLTLMVPKVGVKLFAGGMVRVMLGDVIPMIKNLLVPAPVAMPKAPATQMKDLPVLDSGEEAELSGLSEEDGEDIP